MVTLSAHDEALNALEEAKRQVREEFHKIPDSQEMTIKVCDKLQQTFDNPPVSDFEFFANKPFSADEVRVCLFKPRVEQIPFLVQGLRVGLNMTKGHNLRKLASLLLTLVYLVHRKEWEFIKEFVLADGLDAIVELLQDSNYYERSQAMEILMTVTDCDVFDWFMPPPAHAAHSSHTVQQLHLKLLGLSRNHNFLNNLVKNRIDSYPGGSFRALQQLAFWLSWVRALYTQDQQLRLSAFLLNEIKLWSVASEDDSEDVKEERKLAETLYDDFGKLAPAGGDNLEGVSFPQEISNVTVVPTSESVSVSGQDSANSIPAEQSNITIENVSKLKDEGNEFYKKGLYVEAKVAYMESLDMFEQLAVNNENQGLEISLRSNLANTYWKLFSDEDDSKENNNAAKKILYLDACEQQCQQVLAKDQIHSKAAYRLVNVLIEQKRYKDAYDFCSCFVERLRQIHEQSNVDGAEMFQRLQKRVIANKLLSGEEMQAQEWGFSPFKLRLLQSLIKRNQLQDQVNLTQFSDILEAQIDMKPPSLPTLSEGNLAEKLSTIKLEEIDNELNERRMGDVHKKSSTGKVKVKKEDKVEKDAAPVKLKKLSSDEKKTVQDMKLKARQLAAIQSRDNLEGNDSLAAEYQTLLTSSFEIITKLWGKKFSIRDMYPLPMEETDLLLFLSLISSSSITTSDQLKIVEELAEYDRIQSLLFLAKLEYPAVKSAVETTLTKLKEDNTSKRTTKAINTILKALA